MNNGHYVSYPSSVGYAATFPPRGRLKFSFASERANAVRPYLVTLNITPTPPVSSSSGGLLLYRFFATLENDSKAAVRSEGSRAKGRGGVSHPTKTQTNLSAFTDECRLIIRLPPRGKLSRNATDEG